MLHAYFTLRPFLADAGMYVIEDIQSERDLRLLLHAIPRSRAIDLRRRKGRSDDLLVVIDK